MTSKFEAILLRYLTVNKRAHDGFTLIELLVVIVIIGILSAITLPSFLDQASKAKQSEAKTYIGSINRAQQAYHMENQVFADDANANLLGLGISQQTNSYLYTIHGGGANGAAQHAASALAGATAAVKGYVGAVKVSELNNQATTLVILCEAIKSPFRGGVNPDTQIKAKAAITNPDNGAVAMSCESTNFVLFN
jgi:type IV pilus assembly protein PilA